MTLSEPYWMIRSHDPEGIKWGQERVCDVLGLPCTDRQHPCAVVDATIAPLIVALNERGWTTSFCCSGVEEDHTRGTERDFPPWKKAYILFGDVSAYGLEAILPSIMYIDTRGWCRLSFRRRVTNPIMIKAWKELTERVLAISVEPINNRS